MSKGNIEFGGFGDDEVKEAEEFTAKGRGNFMKLNVGRNVVRILPPRPGEKVMFHYFQHYIEDQDGKGVGFACPKKNANLDCPACDYGAALEKGTAKDKKRAEKFWATKRTLINVIDRADPGAGVKVLAVGKTIINALVLLRKSLEAGEDFTNIDDGFDIAIIREGVGKNDTKYTVLGSRKHSRLLGSEAESRACAAAQPDLATFAKIMDAEEITELTGVSVSQLPVTAQSKSLKSAPASDSDGFDDFLDVADAKDGNF